MTAIDQTSASAVRERATGGAGTGGPSGPRPVYRRGPLRRLRRLPLYLAGLAVFLFSVFPVYWMVITAFKTQEVMVSPALSSFLRSRQVNE